MAVFQKGCKHGWLRDCPVQGCSHACQFPEGDIRIFFGRESSPKRAQELMTTNPAEYRRLRSEAISQGLIPPDGRVPVSLKEPE